MSEVKTPVPVTDGEARTTVMNPPDADVATTSSPSTPHWWDRPRAWAGFFFVLALLPALYVLRYVHKTATLPYIDYFAALSMIFHPDGQINVRGIFSYENEHPFVIPNLVYLIDAKLFHGTNQFAGYYSVLAAALAVVVLYNLLPKLISLPARAFITLCFAVIVFCPTGLWNFVRGMSGAAWLSANLFALLAILMAYKTRSFRGILAATVVSGIALLSYGTGFGAPVALVLLGLLRREKWWRWALPGGLFVVAAVIYAATSNGGSAGANTHDPGLVISTFLSNLGMLWDPDAGATAKFAGGVGILLLAWSAFVQWRERVYTDSAQWWAVGAHAFVAAALISVARGEAFGGEGAQSRYASISALFWIAVLVVVIRVFLWQRGKQALAIGALVAMAVVFLADSPTRKQQAVSQEQTQRVAAVAVHYGASGPFNNSIWKQSTVPLLKALDNYPFNDDFSPGCGLDADATIDLSTVKQLPADFQNGTNGFVDAAGPRTGSVVAGAQHYSGWIRPRPDRAECVLLVDGTGKIVGGGISDVARTDVPGTTTATNQIGYEAWAPADVAGVHVVFGYADGYWEQPPTIATK